MGTYQLAEGCLEAAKRERDEDGCFMSLRMQSDVAWLLKDDAEMDGVGGGRGVEVLKRAIEGLKERHFSIEVLNEHSHWEGHVLYGVSHGRILTEE